MTLNAQPKHTTPWRNGYIETEIPDSGSGVSSVIGSKNAFPWKEIMGEALKFDGKGMRGGEGVEKLDRKSIFYLELNAPSALSFCCHW